MVLSRMRIATVTGIAERLQCCNHGHDMDVVMFFIKTALVRIMLGGRQGCCRASGVFTVVVVVEACTELDILCLIALGRRVTGILLVLIPILALIVST